MQFLLDDKKVYIIIGIVLFICFIIYLLPNKHNITTKLIPITTPGIVGYEPRYFNREIYSMPG